MKRRIILGVLLVVIIILVGILIAYFVFKQTYLGDNIYSEINKSYLYKVSYTESTGSEDYDGGDIKEKTIYVYEDEIITSVSYTLCSYEGCPMRDGKTLSWSKENINKFIKFLDDNFSNYINDSLLEIDYDTLNKYQSIIIDSVFLEESSFEEALKQDRILLYEIKSYSILDCIMPELYLYSDNTYEYYEHCLHYDNTCLPKTGTYDFDVNNVLYLKPGYVTTGDVKYIVTVYTKRESYNIYSNGMLDDALKSIGISYSSLNGCM